MAVLRLNISYYYVSPEQLKQLNAFRAVSGDSEKTFVSQIVRGWIGRYRPDYMALAREDSKARGLSLKEWAKIVLDGDMEALPPPRAEIAGINKLVGINLAPNCDRRNLNYISLSTQNLILIKLIRYYSRDSIIDLISKIIADHLARNWERLYAPQIEYENLDNWQ